MTIDQRDQKSEPDLGHDLDEVRSAWSAMENTEPPALLDQAVLNTARRELDAGRRRKPLRWMGAFATAAVVVLALTIVIQQDEQAPVPVLKKTDGFNLEPAPAASASKAADRDDSRPGARALEAPESDAAQSDAASLSIAEEIVGNAAELKEEEERIPEAQAWIERLLLLRKSGQYDKLAEELAAFRRAYPDYALPPELD